MSSRSVVKWIPSKLKDVAPPQSSFHLECCKTYFKNLLEPIHTILVFETFIFKPENFEKYTSVSSAANRDSWEPSKVRDVPSAYWDNWFYLCFYYA